MRNTASIRKRGAADATLRSPPHTLIKEDKPLQSDPKLTGVVRSQVEDSQLVTQRRAQFVTTAITLFCRAGYHLTTIKEIAEAAGVSPGLIYQYVTDKEDILFLALQLIVHTNEKVVPAAMKKVKHPVHKFMVGFQEYCRVIDENRDAAMLTYRETKSLTRAHREALKNMELDSNELFARCIRVCINSGYCKTINVELFVYKTIMTAHTWALKYWRLHKLVSIEEYIRINLDLLLGSVLTKEGMQSYQDFVKK